MRKQLYKNTEDFLGKAMKEQLLDSMRLAGEAEKELAIAKNQFHQGVPYISVVTDGGWSKRSHMHSYNAKSGVGVIFGLNTKRLLFMGVRNKYCSVCAVAEHKENPHNNTSATAIGVVHHVPWRATLWQRNFGFQKLFMGSAISRWLVMVTAQLSYVNNPTNCSLWKLC